MGEEDNMGEGGRMKRREMGEVAWVHKGVWKEVATAGRRVERGGSDGGGGCHQPWQGAGVCACVRHR